MERMYSIRPNIGIMSLIAEIIELEKGGKDKTRIAIFERALAEAKKQENWQKVYDTFEVEENHSIVVPESVQVKADEIDMELIRKKILSSIEGIKKPKIVFIVRLVLFNYLIKLRENAPLVGLARENKEDISASEMVKILVEIVIMNRSADFELIEDIKEKLIEWRDKIQDKEG